MKEKTDKDLLLRSETPRQRLQWLHRRWPLPAGFRRVPLLQLWATAWATAKTTMLPGQVVVTSEELHGLMCDFDRFLDSKPITASGNETCKPSPFCTKVKKMP